MTKQERLLGILDGSRSDIPAKLARPLLAVLAQVYTAGLEMFLLPYHLGVRRRYVLPCPVISIGNITAGGTGKTPFTILLVRMMQEEGLKIAVLNRGYRGTNEHGAAIVSDFQSIRLNPEAAGDEAWLLANALPGVPVVVGKDRRRTGTIACEEFSPQVIVLDDGLQFYQLHRQLDIGLVDAMNPFDNGWTFPRGLLREPPSHLARCRVLVITNCDKVETERTDRLAAFLREMIGDRTVIRASTRVREVSLLGTDRTLDFDELRGTKVLTACALGNPAAFEDQAEGLGMVIADRFRMPDHAAFSPQCLKEQMEHAVSLGAEYIVMSEKDAVKLLDPPNLLPILVMKIGTVVDNMPLLRAAVRHAVKP